MDSSSKMRPAFLHCCLLLLMLLGTNLLTFNLATSWQSLRFQHSLACPPSSSTIAAAVNSANFQASHELNLTLALLLQTHQQLAHVTSQLQDTIVASNSLREALSQHNSGYKLATVEGAQDHYDSWSSISKELQEFISERKLPLGWSTAHASNSMVSPIGHSCARAQEDLRKYMEYEVGGHCPDDQALAHAMTVHGCEPLPRRRCFAKIPPNFPEPYPLPDCLWTIPPDDSILWTPYNCKSFECLNDRKNQKRFADCIDCFELHGREKHRWTTHGIDDLDLSIDEVLELKPGRIRIGLDIGGGTGTFAVRMREKNVTIITTSLNLDGPFNNFIALRGVVPLFMTVSQRFPFFDNTLDIVHSMHVLSNWIPKETLEFLLFDIDRILRPGGLFWLDHFFCIRPQLDEIYVPMIENLGYKKLKWAIGGKHDRGPDMQEMYLSAVLEKPISRATTTASP